MSKILSAIDIGSNGIRMMIAEVIQNENQPPFLKEVKKLRSSIRLGKEVFLDQPISESTMLESIETFSHFKTMNLKHHVQNCKAVGTSALREAKNKTEFVERIEKSTGIKIDIIDGHEEANLIFWAVSKELHLDSSAHILIDIGGGSVEITFCEKGKMMDSKSFPMGTVRILDQLIKRNLKEDNLKIVMGDFISPLSTYIGNHPLHSSLASAIGTGGNLECMARLKLDLLKKTPNSYVTLHELVEMNQKIKTLSLSDRVEKLNLRPDRADVILPAILIVKTIMRQAGVNKILIPSVGLRNGILWSMI